MSAEEHKVSSSKPDKDGKNAFSDPLEKMRSYIDSLRAAEKKAVENWTNHKDEFDKIIAKHFLALRIRFRSAVVVNEYGGIEKDSRAKEVLKLLEATGITGARFYEPVAQEIAQYIQAKIDAAQNAESTNFDPDSHPTDGHEFEQWVGNALKNFGWSASVTRASGDQGVDVIARKEQMKIGIQCKLYSGAVGNSAVQQVIAGCQFYSLRIGVVISNSSFTKSARELATASSVLLINPSELPFLEAYVIDLMG